MKENNIQGAGSLLEIEGLVAKCQRCNLCQTKNKDVPGVGNEKAEMVFVGEGPGKEEDLQGKPFVGAAGKFLTEMLGDITLTRDDIYITNVIKHRPPNNRDPLPEEVEACWPFLERQLALIRPKLIVFLGRHALNRFFPSLQISKVHGQAFRKNFLNRPQVFLALYHPAAALYNGGMRQTLLNDFKKIPKILEKITYDETAIKNNDNISIEKPIKQEKLF